VCGPGDVLAIFGPSGSGKTTILRAIAGLYRPADASVQSGTETWTNTSNGTFAPPHQRAVGFVFQDYALFPHLTAAGNVITALGHVPRAERQPRAVRFLTVVRGRRSQGQTVAPGRNRCAAPDTRYSVGSGHTRFR
jgi:molybdate transport system ATP-binding protein